MYTVFTTEFDETLHINTFQDWLNDTPGLKDRLTEIVAQNTPQTLRKTKTSTAPITFLLDCSGSMRGRFIFNIVGALRALGNDLEQQGIPFEILGFTTKNWKGGASRKRWIENARMPRSPGRLNDLRHLIIKAFDESWAEASEFLPCLLKEGLLKENIDGEAVEWAQTRLPKEGRLIFISDGTPMDDSTLSVNPADFLKDHLNTILGEAADKGLNMAIVACRDSEKHHTHLWDRDKIFPVPETHEPIDFASTLVRAIEST